MYHKIWSANLFDEFLARTEIKKHLGNFYKHKKRTTPEVVIVHKFAIVSVPDPYFSKLVGKGFGNPYFSKLATRDYPPPKKTHFFKKNRTKKKQIRSHTRMESYKMFMSICTFAIAKPFI